MRIEKWQLPRYFVVLSSYLLLSFVLFSPPEAKARRRHDEGTSEETSPRVAIFRPFPNAKIVRNSDITYFFEQKKSFFPLLQKRGSLGWQKRLSLVTGKDVSRVTKRGFFQLPWANCGLLASGGLVNNSKICKLHKISREHYSSH